MWAGTFRDHCGPVEDALCLILWHVALEPGATIKLTDENIPYEFAVYGIDGESIIGTPSGIRTGTGDITFSRASPRNYYYRPRQRVQQLAILSGERLPLPPKYDGPFVYDSRERFRARILDSQKVRWAD